MTERPPAVAQAREDRVDVSMAHETAFSFPCAGQNLVGILHDAPGATSGVVFVAGGGQYRVGGHRLYVQMARAIAAAGVTVLRFDHRGVGDSAGGFLGFEHLAADIGAAVAELRARAPALGDITLVGLCDGASAALMCSSDVPGVAGLVLVNPWVHSSGLEARARFSNYYINRLQSREFWAKAVTGRLEVPASLRSLGRHLRELVLIKLAGTSGGARPDYVLRMLDCARRYRGRMLVILSGQDLVAQQFEQLVAHDREWEAVLAGNAVQFTRYPAADHTFSSAGHRRLLETRILQWLRHETAHDGHGAA